MPDKQLRALASVLPPMPERLLCGLSGGADSVALIRILLLAGKQAQAVHVNHGLRDEASDGDEAFVRELCRSLDVPLLVYRAAPPENPGEDWARKARYGFFREAMAQTGCEALALAHHRDDQAETLLLHLLRGTGLTGLCGMAQDTVMDGMRMVRPLLGFTRMQLREALDECGQPWREDASNTDTRYLRNAVRMELLPLMERLIPGASGRIASTAALLRGEEDGLQAAASAFLQAHAGSTWLYLRPLAAQPSAMQARILRLWWQRAVGMGMDERALSTEQTYALAALVNASAGKRCNLPGGWHGARGWKCLHLVPEAQATSAEEAALTLPVTALGEVTLTVSDAQGDPGDGRLAQELPRQLLEGCVLRYRRQGDWLKPFGGSYTQSLQDHLVNRRVDAPFRDRIPLLCRGSEVLLVCGVGAGGVPRYDETKDNVRVTWAGEMPWTRGE